jgi:hypothetical protein
LEQKEKTLFPIDDTPLRMVIEVKPEQKENTPRLIDATPSGIVIEVKLEQL